MGAVRMVAGIEFRRRWRTTLAIAILVGFIGAVVLSTMAGARRSNSALRRFNDYSHSASVELNLGPFTPEQLRELQRTPGVAAVGVVRLFALGPTDSRLQSLAVGATVDSTMGTTVDRPRLISGRLANPAAPNEITIGEGLAGLINLHVGQTMKYTSFTIAQVRRALATGNYSNPVGPKVTLKVVGIVRRPLDLGLRGAAGGVVLLTPAFIAKYQNVIGNFGGYAMRIRTQKGQADVGRVTAAATRIFGKQPGFAVQSLAIDSAGAGDAIKVLTDALYIFAAIAAIAGLVAIATVVNRELSAGRAEQPTLRALGVSRRQRVAIMGARILVIATAGSVIAVVGAFLASPLFPLGVARRADPNPGLHADWFVLALGFLAIAGLVMLVGAAVAFRATRRPALDQSRRPRRLGARGVDFAAATGAPPTLTTGLRMAVQPGTGERAVPLRSAFLGAVFGALGVTAVVVFAMSLGHLANTPRLYGWTFDYKAETITVRTCNKADYGLSKQTGVTAVAAVCYENIQFGGRALTGWGFTPVVGAIAPAINEGRAPTTQTEVALGATTMNALHKHIGDTVETQGQKGPVVYRVVGRAVFPEIGDPQPLADGAWFTEAGLETIVGKGDPNFTRYLLLRFAPHADRATVDTHIVSTFGLNPPAGPVVPQEIARLQQINAFPFALAGLLSLLALIAVGHALVAGTRRRRPELAILKTLGFERGQVRATIAWQATTLAVVGLAIGIPLGLLLGNAIWRSMANGLGVTPGATISVLILLLVPAVIVAVNLIAYFPARSASRTAAAVALRTE